MKRIIFLDVDGVLNNTNSKHEHLHSYAPSGAKGLFHPKLKMLKKIIDKTGAYIVLSSSWQDDVMDNTDDGRFLLEELGKYNIKISGFTDPVKYNFFSEDLDELRGRSIKEYLSKEKDQVKFVILDDRDFDFLEEGLLNRFVKTDPKIGLSPIDINKALEKLIES